MKNKILRGIFALVLLSVSPVFLLAIIGIFYILFQIIGGVSFTASVQSFINFIYSLIPYLSYLTTIPVILVLTMLFIKNREKIKKKLLKK